MKLWPYLISCSGGIKVTKFKSKYRRNLKFCKTQGFIQYWRGNCENIGFHTVVMYFVLI
jgi:hypothetical protein